MILPDLIWTKVKSLFGLVTSCLIALARLMLLSVITFLTGVQHILFSRVEVVKVNMACLPYRCDRNEAMDKIAYLDKLCCENPELASLQEDDDTNIDDENGEEE